jgi:serine protease AprX
MLSESTGLLSGRKHKVWVAFALLAALALAAATPSRATPPPHAWVTPTLYERALDQPDETFAVVVRGVPGDSSARIAAALRLDAAGQVKREFSSINGVAGTLTGSGLVKLALSPHVMSITADDRLAPTAVPDQSLWRDSSGVTSLADAAAGAAPLPTIAVVDSGIDARTADFGDRVLAHVNLTPALDAVVDDEGHGTLVAGLAAGAGAFPGIAPGAPLVDVRTSNADGASHTSDVIAAADWILQHKDGYGIRVANFSMCGSIPASFRYDPLDAAVESLWLNGIVVVAAVGNYGDAAGPVSVAYAPGNDPFVISVGALDAAGTASPSDDFLAPWSAHGHTLDGFAKPELSAIGRYLVGPVPAAATLPTRAPDRVVADGYMWMSGTSLSAPLVSGAAAILLARHPGWTPDDVKGALMKGASRTAERGFGGGVGELDVARSDGFSNPPNPNASLERFVRVDSVTGAHSFDGAAWTDAVTSGTWSPTTDWSATDWSATDWSATDWSATDWSATDWSATDWSATDWSATDWSATGWLP